MSSLNIHIESLNDEGLGLASQLTLSGLKGAPMVFVLDIDEFNTIGHKLLPFLNNAERQRYLSYQKYKDSSRFLITRAALKLILSSLTGTPISDLEFGLQEGKKPFLLSSKVSVEFNVSHTSSKIVIAIDQFPIGIDVESQQNIRKAEVLGPRVLSLEEQFSVVNSLDAKGQFCLYWTRKEAFVKAIGKGIDDDIFKVPAMVGQHVIWENWTKELLNWKISSFVLDNEHICSIAYLDKENMDMPLMYRLESELLFQIAESIQ